MNLKNKLAGTKNNIEVVNRLIELAPTVFGSEERATYTIIVDRLFNCESCAYSKISFSHRNELAAMGFTIDKYDEHLYKVSWPDMVYTNRRKKLSTVINNIFATEFHQVCNIIYALKFHPCVASLKDINAMALSGKYFTSYTLYRFDDPAKLELTKKEFKKIIRSKPPFNDTTEVQKELLIVKPEPVIEPTKLLKKEIAMAKQSARKQEAENIAKHVAELIELADIQPTEPEPESQSIRRSKSDTELLGIIDAFLITASTNDYMKQEVIRKLNLNPEPKTTNKPLEGAAACRAISANFKNEQLKVYELQCTYETANIQFYCNKAVYEGRDNLIYPTTHIPPKVKAMLTEKLKDLGFTAKTTKLELNYWEISWNLNEEIK